MILQLTQSLDPEAGGMVPAVVGMHHHLRQDRVDSVLAGTTARGLCPLPAGVHAFRRRGPASFNYAEGYFSFAEEKAAQADAIFVHGLWSWPNLVAGHLARRFRTPLVIHPHGMLEPWALARSAWKKRLVRALYERRNYRTAALWRALTAAEERQILTIAPEARVVVIPNGVEIPPDAAAGPALTVTARHPELMNRKWLLFLARLHPKKGLDLLVRAWAGLQRQFPGWQLVIAGPDDGAEADTRAFCRQEGLEDRVTFTGLLQGTEKWAVLRGAELFVLPSYSEGFSVAVIEALAMGVPVVVTRECHFPEAAEEGCGLECGATVDDLRQALKTMMSHPEHHLQQMGAVGAALAAGRYSWRAVVDKTRRSLETLGVA